MTDFITFNVPKCFFSYVIFGYIGCKIDVEMKDGSRVPVSRRLYITVMKDFNLYMAGKTV